MFYYAMTTDQRWPISYDYELSYQAKSKKTMQG